MKLINYNKILGFVVLSCLSFKQLNAQQEQMYTHYDFNSLAMNPAYAGSKRTLVATALNRVQWANYPGAPRYQSFGVHSPVGNSKSLKDFAVGFNVQTGKIGKFAVASPFSENEFAGNIAYHKQITRDLRLAVGLRLGAYNYNAQLTKLQLQNPNDQVYSQDYSITAPMTGFGVYLYSDKFFASVSSPRMVFVKQKLTPSGYNLNYISQMHYYATAGIVLDISNDIKLKPTTQIKFINGVPMQADFNLHAFYKNLGSIGGFYRTGGDLGFMVNLQLNSSFNLLYSFDSKTSPLNSYVKGSNEFGLIYMIPYKQNSSVKVPRYF